MAGGQSEYVPPTVMKDIRGVTRLPAKISSLLTLLTISFLYLSSYQAVAEDHQPEVLILNSYHTGEEWSDKQIAGITSTLKESYPHLVPSLEHLDAKRFPGPQHSLFFAQYLETKYKEKDFDLIMVLDNPAFDLILKFRPALFASTPVVFAGINNFQPELIDKYSNLTGVAEVLDMAGTLALVLDLHPRTRSVFVVSDYTSTGLIVRREMEKAAEQFKDRIKIHHNRRGSFEDLERELKALPTDTVVIILSYFTDEKGRTLSREESTRLISNLSPVPAYSVHETRLGHGIVGGLLLEGEEHGRQAAEIALKILSGVNADSIPVEVSRSLPAFDHNLLKRFEIPVKELPANSIVINRPDSFWNKHRAILIPVVLIIGMFLVVLVLMGLAIISIRRAEEKVRKSEALLKTTQQLTHVGGWEWDTKNQSMFWTDELYRIHGFSPGEVKPGSAEHIERSLQCYDPADRPVILQAFTECAEQGRSYDLEFPFTRVSGERIWIRTLAEPVCDQGRIAKVIGNVWNITDQKLAELKLRESEEKYRTLFEKMLDGFAVHEIICDASGKPVDYRFISVNPAFEQMTGLKADDVIGQTVLEVLPNTEPFWIETYGRVALTGDPVTFERHHPDLGRHFDITAYRPTEGEFACIFQDITARKRAESEREKLEAQLQQAYKMEAIGTLAGGIAHDFNNILSPIMIHTEMVMEDLPPGSPLLKNMKEIYRASERARDLVRQILTFSRQHKEKRVAVNVSRIAKEAIKLLRSTLPSTIDMAYDLQTEQDRVLADPSQLHRIIMNLATNAAHAMEEKGGCLEVVISNQDLDAASIRGFPELAPGPYVRLSVKDSGHGIEPQHLAKIFEPYFTTKEVGKGTGMGLALVHGIVKGYGGNVTVYSEVGQGTTFHVYLPMIEEEPGLRERKAGEAELPRGTERVLFVDDEPAAVGAMKSMLESLGYRVTARTSSLEALEAFRNRPHEFDLVITDMTMPNMTGRDLARELMAVRPDIPIILCTGFSERIDEQGAQEMGIRAFVMKPVVMSEMARTIREALGAD